MKALLASSFTRFLSVGTALTLFLDLAQPLFPFAMTAFISFLGLTLILLGLQSIKMAREAAHRLLPFTTIMMVLSLGLWMSQSFVQNADENGVLASKVPAFQNMQNQMTQLIDTNVRIADATENIAETSSRTAKATENLANNAKKETSADPRKELSNIGLPWGEQNFWKALSSNDTRALQLFMNSGLPVSKLKIWKKARMGGISPAASKSLASVGFSFTKEECNLQKFESGSAIFDIEPHLDATEKSEVAWKLAGGFYGVLGLAEEDTAKSLAVLCPNLHLKRSINAVVSSGLKYPEIHELSRDRAIASCKDNNSKISFENYLALAYSGGDGLFSKLYFEDEHGVRVTPQYPDRPLSTSERFIKGKLYSELYDAAASGYEGIVVRRNSVENRDNSLSGYKSILDRVCEVAFPKLETYLMGQYRKIERNFGSQL
ncbi:hypothetical protein [Roseovarius sp.]|uniref:hypothetical protein n=1 Tax=Roseovarius sp. TaxID=1486281 RepID=UPI003D10201F